MGLEVGASVGVVVVWARTAAGVARVMSARRLVVNNRKSDLDFEFFMDSLLKT